jgi:hypothetical protein
VTVVLAEDDRECNSGGMIIFRRKPKYSEINKSKYIFFYYKVYVHCPEIEPWPPC